MTGAARAAFGGGIRGGPMGIGVVLVLLVLTLLTGKNFLSLVDPGVMSGGGEAPSTSAAPVETSPEEEKLVDFMNFVLKRQPADVEPAAPAGSINPRHSCCFARPPARRAGTARRPAVRSIVRVTARSTWTSASSTSCIVDSALLAISPRRMSSRTKWDITFRI